MSLLPKPLLYTIVWFLETGAKRSGKEPSLTTNDLRMFYGLAQDFDIGKARRELGFPPKPPQQAVREALAYLRKHESRLASRQG